MFGAFFWGFCFVFVKFCDFLWHSLCYFLGTYCLFLCYFASTFDAFFEAVFGAFLVLFLVDF